MNKKSCDPFPFVSIYFSIHIDFLILLVFSSSSSSSSSSDYYDFVLSCVSLYLLFYSDLCAILVQPFGSLLPGILGFLVFVSAFVFPEPKT